MSTNKLIGIITFPLNNNCGTALQTYALQYIMKELGADVTHVVIKHKSAQSKKSFLYRLKCYLKKDSRYTFFDKLMLKKCKKYYNLRTKKFQEFYKLYINQETYESIHEFIAKSSCFQSLIVGSDQVWANHNREVSDVYLLNFDGYKGNKYSYAASMNLNITSDSEMHRLVDCFLQFNMVSVREPSSIQKYFEEMLFKDVITHPKLRADIDPTLLITADKWKLLISSTPIKSQIKVGDYVLLYMLRPQKEMIKKAYKEAKRLGKRLVYCGLIHYSYRDMIVIDDLGVEDFLWLIYNAYGIVTNSFHTVVFSIIFDKSFIAQKVAITGNRTEELLDLLNLKERLISNSDEICEKLDNPVDYSIAKKILAIKKQESIDYIKDIINNK